MYLNALLISSQNVVASATFIAVVAFCFVFFFFYIDLIRTVVAFYCLFSLSASRGLDNKLKYQEVIRNVFVTGSLYEIFTQIMEVFVFCFGWFYYIILS